DPHRLEEALVNLLTNAYRYGGAEVEVATHVDGARVTIAVSDDGPGVEPELQPSLFEPFSRGRTSRAVDGSGLGLAITRCLLETLGGRVDYESRVPHGARFVLEL